MMHEYMLVPREPTEEWAKRLAADADVSVDHALGAIIQVIAASPEPPSGRSHLPGLLRAVDHVSADIKTRRLCMQAADLIEILERTNEHR